MEQLSLTIDRLIIDTANVRKHKDDADLASLLASIPKHGIIQPLVVRPPLASDNDLAGERYRVTGGGRRYRALTQLIADRALKPDFPIPVIVRQDNGEEDAREISLAENLIRLDMRPVDEFRAFKQLIEGGASVADIALRFGATERLVKSRLALADLHPTILEAFDREEIPFAAAAAYTVNPDPEAQIRFFNEAAEWYRRNPDQIRHGLMKEALRANSQVAQFIGEEAYLAAGGHVQVDLFADNRFWTSTDIVERLKAEKIDALRAEYLADGWSFFETEEEFGTSYYSIQRLRPDGINLSPEEVQRMEELEGELEGLDADDFEGDQLDDFEKMTAEYNALEAKALAFTPEQKARSGVVISTERMTIVTGALREGANADAYSGKAAASKKEEADPLALTAPVKSALGTVATLTLAGAVEKKPDLALALLATMLTMSDSLSYGIAKPSRLKVERAPGHTGYSDHERSFTEIFADFRDMKAADIKKELGRLIANTIDLSEEWLLSVKDEKRFELRRAMFDAFGADPVTLFDPEAFFSGSRKPVIQAAWQEMTGDEMPDGKKGDMAALAANKAQETGWLPEFLRPTAYRLKKK